MLMMDADARLQTFTLTRHFLSCRC